MGTENPLAVSDKRELGKLHSDAQQKFSYYITGLSIAGIAFITNQTSDKPFEWPQIALGISVLSWGWSTVSGLKFTLNFLEYLESTDVLIDLNRVLSDPNHASYHLKNTAQKNHISKKISKLQKKGIRLWGNMTIGFVLGLISYVIWHLIEMYLKTNPPA